MKPQKRVFVTGATGFVGRQLAMRLRREGYAVVAWVRDREAAAAVLGAEVELLSTKAPDEAMRAELTRCDAVINLAGAPIGRRIGGRYAETVRTSRIETTRRIVRVMAGIPEAKRPEVLVSASAVGYYGDRGDLVLDESSPAGEGFLAALAADWEAEARVAEQHGIRVSIVRISMVLGPEGGALAKLLPVFGMGLGGRIGSGKQWTPWVHMDDLVALLVTAVQDPDYGGTLMAAAPDLVTNRDFTRALGEVLGRPTLLPVPAFAIRLALARGAEALLDSVRAEPRETQGRGFRFTQASLGNVLRDVLDHRGVLIRRLTPGDQRPDHEYVRRRRPTHVLEQETWVDAPLDEVFPFFSAAQNLGAITPPALDFRIVTPEPIEIHEGRVIDYAISLGPLPMRWRTVIERWEPGRRFVDAQHRGPYRCWFHEHEFEAHGDRTRMIDRVWFAAPFGFIGRITNRLFIFDMLRRIFGFRARVIEQRFGTAAAPRSVHDTSRAA